MKQIRTYTLVQDDSIPTILFVTEICDEEEDEVGPDVVRDTIEQMVMSIFNADYVELGMDEEGDFVAIVTEGEDSFNAHILVGESQLLCF